MRSARSVLEQQQPDHEPALDPGPALVAIERLAGLRIVVRVLEHAFNNARGWMVRDQLNNYRRNLSEMAKSMTRHIKNNSPRISLHHVSPILGKIQIMFNDGGRSEVPQRSSTPPVQRAAGRVYSQK
jgi:hypothetical protein